MSLHSRRWQQRLAVAVRDALAELATTEEEHVPAVVRRAAGRFEAAPTPDCDAILANTMLLLCLRTFELLHASRSGELCACATDCWPLLSGFVRRGADTRRTACVWAEACVVAVRRNHQPNTSLQAGEIIRRECSRPLTILDVARRLGVSRRRLSAEFRGRFGMGPLAYLHLARIARAVDLMEAPGKIEWVSAEAGYRSRKDFYRALRDWTGMTPGEVRALPRGARRRLAASLQTRCLWRTPSRPSKHHDDGSGGDRSAVFAADR
jgi:AraC family transcriptional activator of mar-sox-rob regulon/AraC family mar-sox-rob regulon transcriptional activator